MNSFIQKLIFKTKMLNLRHKIQDLSVNIENYIIINVIYKNSNFKHPKLVFHKLIINIKIYIYQF
jgi:hypothetical protein